MHTAIRAALVALLLAMPALAQTRPITVVYIAASDILPVFVAQDSGIFARNGLDVTLSRTAVTPNVIPVLLSGNAQIGVSTPPHLLQGSENGLDLVIASGGSRIVATNPTISLVARPDIAIKSAADLEGKRVGVPGIMGMVDLVLRTWLARNNVPPDSVKLVEASIPQMTDLLNGRSVDAVTAIEPIRSRAVKSGAGYIAAEFFSDVNPDAPGIFWIATREWARNNPDSVRKFRASLDQAIVAIGQDPAAARATEAKYLGLNAPRLPEYRTEVTVQDLAFFANLLKQFGLIQKVPDLPSLLPPG